MITTDKLSAFTGRETTIAGKTLRPLTGATLLLLEDTGNILLAENLDALKPSAMQLVGAVAQFMFLHSRPAAEVFEMRKDAGKATTALYEIADSLPITDIAGIADEINEHLKRLHATRDWEVAGQSGAPFTSQSGPPSTSPKSPN